MCKTTACVWYYFCKPWFTFQLNNDSKIVCKHMYSHFKFTMILLLSGVQPPSPVVLIFNYTMHFSHSFFSVYLQFPCPSIIIPLSFSIHTFHISWAVKATFSLYPPVSNMSIICYFQISAPSLIILHFDSYSTAKIHRIILDGRVNF